MRTFTGGSGGGVGADDPTASTPDSNGVRHTKLTQRERGSTMNNLDSAGLSLAAVSVLSGLVTSLMRNDNRLLK